MAFFNDILRNLRKQHKLTQKELAVKLNLADSTISMYERGQREPDFETLEAIADYFGVTMDYLYGKGSAPRSKYIYYPTYPLSPIENNNVIRFIYRNGYCAERVVSDNEIQLLNSITSHEQTVITAYRNRPEMQPAVDTLLGISPTIVEVAAKGGVEEHAVLSDSARAESANNAADSSKRDGE